MSTDGVQRLTRQASYESAQKRLCNLQYRASPPMTKYLLIGLEKVVYLQAKRQSGGF